MNFIIYSNVKNFLTNIQIIYHLNIYYPNTYKFHFLLTSRNKKTLNRLAQFVFAEDGDLGELTECVYVCVRLYKYI